MGARVSGFGSLQEIRPGYWRIWVSAGRDPVTGKRRRVSKYVRGTKRQAERALMELVTQVTSKRVATAPARYTVADLLDAWFEEMAPEWREQTRSTQEARIRHLKALLGHVKVRQLDATTIQAAVNTMREQGYAPNTINARLGTLRGAVRRAIELGWLHYDPFLGVRLPQAPRTKGRVLTDEQLEQVLREVRKSRWGLAILLAARTGLRRGEILALRWSDLDWETGELRVERTIIESQDGVKIQPYPKTRSSVRTVVLDEYMLGLLRRHRHQQAVERLKMGPAWQDHDLIFPGKDGRPAGPAGLYNAVARTGKRLGMPWLRPHDLRHAHASQLLAAGWSPADVAERLGHAHAGITMALYAHALPGRQRELVQKLGVGTEVAPNWGD